jgi:hypothetical protein
LNPRRDWNRVPLPKVSSDIALQQIKVLNVISPQDMTTALGLEPQRHPKVRVNRTAEHRGRPELVLEQSTRRTTQTSPGPYPLTASSRTTLRSSQMSEHQGAAATARTPHQHVIREVVHADPRVAEPIIRLRMSTHQPMMPDKGEEDRGA